MSQVLLIITLIFFIANDNKLKLKFTQNLLIR